MELTERKHEDAGLEDDGVTWVSRGRWEFNLASILYVAEMQSGAGALGRRRLCRSTVG